MRIRLHHMKRSFGGSKMGKCWQFLVVRPICGKNLAPYQNAAKAPSSSGRFLPHCTDRVVRVRAAGKYGGHEGGWARNAERSLRGRRRLQKPSGMPKLVPASLSSFQSHLPTPHTHAVGPPDLIKVTSTWQKLSPHLSPASQQER